MSGPVRMTTREHLAWLLAYWRPHPVFAAGLVLLTLLSGAVAVAFPLVWKLVVDGLGALPQRASPGCSPWWRWAGRSSASTPPSGRG